MVWNQVASEKKLWLTIAEDDSRQSDGISNSIINPVDWGLSVIWTKIYMIRLCENIFDFGGNEIA